MKLHFYDRGLRMKVSSQSLDESSAVCHSLEAMRKAKAELSTSTCKPTTRRALAERIELCKDLLREIANVQAHLALHLQRGGQDDGAVSPNQPVLNQLFGF